MSEGSEPVRRNCSRCGVGAPDSEITKAWAHTFTLGIMCPDCYEGLQRVRREASHAADKMIADYMNEGARDEH